MNDAENQKNNQTGSEEFRTALLYAFGSVAFAAVAGLIYATGYLVEFTFLESLGIKSPSSDATQAKYAYIGLLCLQFPLSMFLFDFGIRKVRRIMMEHELPKKTTTDGKPPEYTRAEEMAAMKEARHTDMWPRKTTARLFFLLLFAFFLLIAFSRPQMGSFHENQGCYAILFIVSLLGIRFMRGFERRVRRHRNYTGEHWFAKPLKQILDGVCSKRDEYFWGEFGRIGILLVALGLTIWIFRGLWPMLLWIIVSGGYLYIGLAYLSGLVARRAMGEGKTGNIKGIRASTICYCSAVALAFLYFAVVSFSYRVYSYIPANRGGGDYTGESNTVLTFDSQSTNSVPTAIVITNVQFQSKPVIVLHESANMIYVALPVVEQNGSINQTNGPIQWRDGGPMSKPKFLFALKRETIISMGRCTDVNTIYETNQVPSIQ